MRKYWLASKEARLDVDLLDFQDEIIEAVHQVMPTAAVKVTQSYYTVSPTPSKGEAIRIGRQLSKKEVLGSHCIKIPKLFNGENI